MKPLRALLTPQLHPRCSGLLPGKLWRPHNLATNAVIQQQQCLAKSCSSTLAGAHTMPVSLIPAVWNITLHYCQ